LSKRHRRRVVGDRGTLSSKNRAIFPYRQRGKILHIEAHRSTVSEGKKEVAQRLRDLRSPLLKRKKSKRGFKLRDLPLQKEKRFGTPPALLGGREEEIPQNSNPVARGRSDAGFPECGGN